VSDGEKARAVEPQGGPSARLSGRPALKAHATLAAGLALCVAAFWFEIGRALGGNSLSWAYVFEWPLLGAFAVYMWWKVIHPDAEGSKIRDKKARTKISPEFEGMLAAWQDHQEELVKSREPEAGPEAEHQ